MIPAVMTFICAIALLCIDTEDKVLVLSLLFIGALSAMAALISEFVK